MFYILNNDKLQTKLMNDTLYNGISNSYMCYMLWANSLNIVLYFLLNWKSN